ncbi:S8 family peptidase [Rubrivirga sp.]|uniref:S8 family peptidase n=1 Tax=Rubrivirga sp. TaxID=1885344 RepID=UPI003B525AC5
MSRPLLLAALAALLAAPVSAQTDDGVLEETRVDRVHAEYGLTGAGVIVSVFDRGIDYEHPDFRNADGTTRIRMIYDLVDDAGANDADNPTGFGTVYTRQEIDAALASGTRLATRDASGHGTATAGVAAGNGRASDGRYLGMAPDAELVVVKFTSEGAPAHDGEPAEAPFFRPEAFTAALDFVHAHAAEAGMPVVHLGNFGSSGGPMDGTSRFARAINERFGPGHPGRVFLTGTSDDGGVANHAGGVVEQGDTAEIGVQKGHAGFLRFELWYPGADEFTIEIVSPSGAVSGPFTAPASGFASESGAGFTYVHLAPGFGFYEPASDKRGVVIDLSGGTGNWTVRVTGAAVADGRFDALLNPSNIFGRSDNVFTTFVDPGHTVWDWASAEQNIAPTSYVLKPTWTDIDGVTRTFPGNEVGTGELWPGSGIGPTYDGRLGVSVAAPGQGNITPYAPRSFNATFRGNLIEDGPAPYGILAAVSGAAPVVQGIVALMLQTDPTLDAAQVRDALEQTARADAFTGEVPNVEWGWGKVDAFAAVASVRPVSSEGGPDGALGLAVAPNPAGASVALAVTVGRAGRATVAVYDVLGREVARPLDGPLAAGTHRVRVDTSDLPAGLYVVRAVMPGGSASRTVTVVR